MLAARAPAPVSPAPTPLAPCAPCNGFAADAAAQPACPSPQSDNAARRVGAGGIDALFSAVERVDRQKAAQVRASEAIDEVDKSQNAGSASRMQEVQFKPHAPIMPEGVRFHAQGKDGESTDEGEEGDAATRVNASGFVDAVIPRRRGKEKKVVLTRELLESYYHESLDSVTERLGLSKTTIKAACRRLGLPKWPYQHTGPRKRRMAVLQPEQAESEQERALKATFHELMGNTDRLAAYNGGDLAAKRQRMGDMHLHPNAVMGQPAPLPPNASQGDLQAMMQIQSLSALSAMVTALNASGQQLGAFNSGQFPPQQAFPVPPQMGGQPPMNFGGNYAMHDGHGGFQQWGAQ